MGRVEPDPGAADVFVYRRGRRRQKPHSALSLRRSRAGTRLARHHAEPGPAFFIDAEDEDKELHRRLANILSHYDASFQDVIDGGLYLRSFVGEDAVLATTTKGGIVQPTALYNSLLERAGDLKPKMIGIASSANVFAGNEVARPDVQQFVGLLTHLAMAANGAVNLIAHPSLTGINTDTGLSGSTQWHNASAPACGCAAPSRNPASSRTTTCARSFSKRTITARCRKASCCGGRRACFQILSSRLFARD